MKETFEQIPIFPGAGGLNTAQSPTLIEPSQAQEVENATFDRQSVESPGGWRKLHREIPKKTALNFSPPTISRTARDQDAAICPYGFIPYHETQDPATQWQLDLTFRTNHRNDDTLTGADLTESAGGYQITAPFGGEFQFQPLAMRGGDAVNRLQWILGYGITSPEGGSSASEFLRPVFYWWDIAAARLKFSAALFAVRPGFEHTIQLQIGLTAGESQWVIDGEVREQITVTDLIVALPAGEDLYDEDTHRPLYIARAPAAGRYLDAAQVNGIYGNGASAWSATTITPDPALPITTADAWIGYFVRRVGDGEIHQVTDSSTTLVFPGSTWSSPSAADEFDLIPPMEAVNQDVTLGEVHLWSAPQFVKPWDFSAVHQADGFLPQIRMQPGDEEKGIPAFMYRSDNGAEWKMRGVNFLKNFGHWKTFFEDQPNALDEDTLRIQLQALRAGGMNTVRMIFNGRFALQHGFLHPTDTELPDEFTERTARFVELCTEAGLYCIICLDQLPQIAYYLQTVPEDTSDCVISNSAGVNEEPGEISYGMPATHYFNSQWVSPKYHVARLQYLRDYSAGIRRVLSDSRHESTILSFEIQNEGNVSTGESPLTEAERTGGFFIRNPIGGGVYSMAVDAERRAFVLSALTAALNAEAALLRELWPETMIGIDIWTACRLPNMRLAPNHFFKRDSSDANPYPLHAIQDSIDADYFSIHVYLTDNVRGATHNAADILNTISIAQYDTYARVLVCGEIGVDIATYPALDAGTKALTLETLTTLEELGFKGYLWWVYDFGTAAGNSTEFFYCWNDDEWVEENTGPALWPAYFDVPRSATLDFALYPGTATADERLAIANAEGLELSQLVGYWPLDDDGGAMLRDLSATKNHGWMNGAPFDPTRPGEVMLDGERTALQFDLSEEPDLFGAFKHALGNGGRYDLCFRLRGQLCRDIEDNGEAAIEDCLFETLIDLDDPTAESQAPVFSLRLAKFGGVLQFYVAWNHGGGNEFVEIANAVESNPQTSATLALGLRPAVGREFTLLAGIQKVDGASTAHRVYVWSLNSDNQAVGYSVNVSPATGTVQLADPKKNRISFGASVAPGAQGAGTHNAAMLRISDAAWAMHPCVDTRSVAGGLASLQRTMQLSPFVSPAAIREVTMPIAADAGLVSLTNGSAAFALVGDGLIARDVRYYPINWVAMVAAVRVTRRRENRPPFDRPKFVYLESLTTTSGTLGDIWDEPSQPATALLLAAWLGHCEFPSEIDALTANPTPKSGESWALTPLWRDRGALGSIDPVSWHLALLPSRPSVAQEAYLPRWDRGVVKGFEPIRKIRQVELGNGEVHTIAAASGSLFRSVARRVVDHPFYGEARPVRANGSGGGAYEWCIEFPERPPWLAKAEERRQPLRVSRDRQGDPWPEDGLVHYDAERKFWIPNNAGGSFWWLFEAWIKVPSPWGKRTLFSRVGTEQGATGLVESVNCHIYLDSGAPELEIRDDLNSNRFLMSAASNAKAKIRDIIRKNEWFHVAAMLELDNDGSALLRNGDSGFFVNGRRLDSHILDASSMTVLDIPDNVTQSYQGVFGQAQLTRRTAWQFGLRGRMTMARIRTRTIAFDDFDPLKDRW